MEGEGQSLVPPPNVLSSVFLVPYLTRLNTNVEKAIVLTFTLGCYRNQKFLASRNQNPLRILLAFKQSEIKSQLFLFTARKSKSLGKEAEITYHIYGTPEQVNKEHCLTFKSLFLVLSLKWYWLQVSSQKSEKGKSKVEKYNENLLTVRKGMQKIC